MRRILTQLGRELLLLESSDWQFLISTWSARDYAELRFVEHDANCGRLARIVGRYAQTRQLEQGDRVYLQRCEAQNPIFSELDISAWSAD
jgi:1,4-alpha-glucan branching enzyme